MWPRLIPLLASSAAWIAEQAAAMAIPYFLERLLRGMGAKGPVNVWTKDLTSGYDTEADRRQKMDKNAAYLDALVKDEKYQPKTVNGRVVETYCNFALQAYAEQCGYSGFKGLTANEIYSKAAQSKEFTPDSAERAVEHAKKGGFSFAAKQYPVHGHCAAVYPGPMVYSGSWAKQVPLVANIGKSNGIMATSLAFSVKDGEPVYFLYKVGEV